MYKGLKMGSFDACGDCDQVHHETSSRQLHSHSTYVRHQDMAHWGYHDIEEEGEYGPASWAKNYEAAGGKRQSPINIDTKVTKPNSFPDLAIQYDPSRCTKIVNNGHTFTVEVTERSTNLFGGPLQHKYQLAQFHCHWGSSDEKGAEHTIDGHRYAAELHLVHWNTELFENIGEAIKADGGIAVLGVFIKAGKENPTWQHLTPHLQQVKYKGESFRMKKGFNPATLLPENMKDYWTYAGSLTTPPCYESVQFILFKEPVEVSTEQLNELRALSEHCKNDIPRGSCSGKMQDNFRPCMPLNGRVVTASFS
ncbi:carbonic anhydrase-like isoform X2 [Amphiura filiformis]|uniref:carbonic anhydrase-like isoform X2 n=1 Tax=Amphiura filiformis TaxID=82378 RepID=UPI003B227924